MGIIWWLGCLTLRPKVLCSVPNVPKSNAHRHTLKDMCVSLRLSTCQISFLACQRPIRVNSLHLSLSRSHSLSPSLYHSLTPGHWQCPPIPLSLPLSATVSISLLSIILCHSLSITLVSPSKCLRQDGQFNSKSFRARLLL